MQFLVRGSELNCRSGWSTDLWEPNGDRPEALDRPRLGPTAGAAERADPVPDYLNLARRPAAATGSEAEGIDLVVHEMPSPRMGTEPASRPAPSTEATDARDLILRARDIHRLRLANRTRPTLAPGGVAEAPLAEGPAAADLPAAGRGPEPNADGMPDSNDRRDAPALSPDTAARLDALTARMAEMAPVPPVPASELRPELLGWGATRHEAEERFETVPAVDPTFKLPFRAKQRTVQLRAGFDEEPPAGEAGDPPLPAAIDPPAAATRPTMGQPPPVDTDRVVPPAANVPATQRPTRFAEPGSVDGPKEQRSEPTPRHRRPEAPWAVAEEREPPIYSPSASRLDDRDDDPLDEVLVAAPLAAPGDPQSGRRRDEDALVANGNAWPLGDDVEVWPEEPAFLQGVSRCCRTCRDFRPADGGERGWCNSAWAFQHRRMVHADELPCQSAIGIWWLAHDDVWLDDLDVDHAQRTPLVDAMLARHATGARREARGERPEERGVRRGGRR